MEKRNWLGHTMEDDFQHFLSYSGLRSETREVIDKMSLAFDAAWQPVTEPDRPTMTTKVVGRHSAHDY